MVELEVDFSHFVAIECALGWWNVLKHWSAVMETNVQLYGFLNWLKGEIMSFQKLLKLLKSCLQVYRYTNEGYGWGQF
jgi:hypothetical protein